MPKNMVDANIGAGLTFPNSHEYTTVMQSPFNHPRGFTPFQFSSRKNQVNTTQLGGLIPDNPISSLLSEATSWYEMWINPDKVSLNREYSQKHQYTAGSIVTYHYRPNMIKMAVSGAVGWIQNGIQEDYTPLTGVTIQNIVKKDNKDSNSPRVFLRRLRDLADEPMYFIGLDGVEHYNTKYIKIYTKQYPAGMVCEGYFTKFDVPESGDDSITVNYSFDFNVESMKPITYLQKLAGMFGSKGGNALGKTIRAVPGLG